MTWLACVHKPLAMYKEALNGENYAVFLLRNHLAASMQAVVVSKHAQAARKAPPGRRREWTVE